VIDSEPGMVRKHHQVRQCRQRDERGEGHFELLVELFRLLLGKSGQALLRISHS